MLGAAFRHGADPAACRGFSLSRALKLMPPVADFLMDHGVSPDLVVHKVAGEGLVEIMDKLLRRGADLELREPQYEATPLATAARAGHLEMVKLLLSRGARTRHAGDPEWSTPAFWAERNGHLGILELLRQAENGGM